MWKERIKREWNEDPLKVVALGALAGTALAQLLNAMSAAQGRRAYARQVNYRIARRHR